jgi:uncharacterized heparinase superfamily protein
VNLYDDDELTYEIKQHARKLERAKVNRWHDNDAKRRVILYHEGQVVYYTTLRLTHNRDIALAARDEFLREKNCV